MTPFRSLYKFVKQHPFVFAVVLYFIILHQLFPFLFSLLISALPVLICTALLLAALLIHGQNSSNTISDGDRMSNISNFMNNGASDYSYTRNKEMGFLNDRFAEVRHDIVGKETRVLSGIGFGSQMDESFTKKGRGYDNNSCFNMRRKDFESKSKDHLSSIVSDRRHVVVSSKHESSDSDSDTAEKSALDALVANVILTPQETHPLLECGGDPLQHQQFLETMYNDLIESEAEAQSLDSNQSSDDDDDDQTQRTMVDENKSSPFDWTDKDQRILQELRNSEIEKNEHLESLISRAEDDGSDQCPKEEDRSSSEEEDDDDEDDEDEENESIDTEKNGSKNVTMWTEEDEKNLKHLGSSEIERNQRLENLLARRRTQRNFSMISERNLIDLDRSDNLPFHVAPISTTRVNPFDHIPNDTNNQLSNTTTPPIPGSAPSTTLPRKNPFDSPCTSPKGLRSHLIAQQTKPSMNNKEILYENRSLASDHMEGFVRPESPKQSLFRRYESFSTVYNYMEDDHALGNDSTEFDMRRDFAFRRHETFNTRSSPFSSMFDSEKPLFVSEQEVVHEVRDQSLERQSSQASENSVESAKSTDSESSPATVPTEERESNDRDNNNNNNKEVLLSGENDHNNSSHVGTESEHSESSNNSVNDGEDENEDDKESTRSNEVNNVDSLYQKEEVLHENQDTTSSSLSSEHDTDTSVNETAIDHKQIEDPEIEEEANHFSTDDEIQSVGPVYDTSPSCTEKNASFSSS